MAWYLNRALSTFRAEVDRRWPGRDRTSDGTIGDAAHAATASDHNPDRDGSVDAWDMDVNLRSGNDGVEIERLKRLFETHPASRYWIHNRIIASRSWGWARRHYTGSNPHDRHIHWNTREGYEDSTRPWGVAEEETDMDAAQAAKLDKIADQVNNLYAAVFTGGPSCGYATAPENGRAPGSSLVNKLDVIIETSGASAELDDDELSRIGQSVADALGNSNASATELAEILKPILGDRAPAVGAALLS